MSVVVTFTVPGESLPLGRAAPADGVRVELDSVVPLGDETHPYVWVYADEEAKFAAFREGLRAEPGIEALTELDALEDRRLYKFGDATDHDSIVGSLADADGALLAAGGDSDTWTFEMRFQSEDGLQAFQSSTAADGDLTVESFSTPCAKREDDPDHGLSASQRETLRHALDAGYYDVPRRTTMVDVAEEFGISDQSLSERLRRAHATLVENTLE